ncbi:hypothetical protein Nepgr_006619 [Nepenthes gracilis]|uniref:Uncharacterized protein n=1 Tax=Nepenthes gracilis TaxID=150966 RepID=A0AAD3S5Q7_NEPGR|nr:hypothetical protein Nepgr_006619 [Nepenthes gracilis]
MLYSCLESRYAFSCPEWMAFLEFLVWICLGRYGFCKDGLDMVLCGQFRVFCLIWSSFEEKMVHRRPGCKWWSAVHEEVSIPCSNPIPFFEGGADFPNADLLGANDSKPPLGSNASPPHVSLLFVVQQNIIGGCSNPLISEIKIEYSWKPHRSSHSKWKGHAKPQGKPSKVSELEGSIVDDKKGWIREMVKDVILQIKSPHGNNDHVKQGMGSLKGMGSLPLCSSLSDVAFNQSKVDSIDPPSNAEPLAPPISLVSVATLELVS